jgi:hypothetical protein
MACCLPAGVGAHFLQFLGLFSGVERTAVVPAASAVTYPLHAGAMLVMCSQAGTVGEFYATVVSDQPVWLRTEEEELAFRVAEKAAASAPSLSTTAPATTVTAPATTTTTVAAAATAAVAPAPEDIAAALKAMASRQVDLVVPQDGEDDDGVDDDSKYRLTSDDDPVIRGRASKAGGFLNSESAKKMIERADRIAAIHAKEDEWRVSGV